MITLNLWDLKFEYSNYQILEKLPIADFRIIRFGIESLGCVPPIVEVEWLQTVSSRHGPYLNAWNEQTKSFSSDLLVVTYLEAICQLKFIFSSPFDSKLKGTNKSSKDSLRRESFEDLLQEVLYLIFAQNNYVIPNTEQYSAKEQ